MTQSKSTSWHLQFEDQELVDRIADDYESDRGRLSGKVMLEDYLARAPTHLAEPVLLELLTVELQLKENANEPLIKEEYLARFPNAKSIVEKAFSYIQAGENEDAPSRIANYRKLRELGEGGFGKVCLYEDELLKRQVAIKIPRRTNQDYDSDRLLSEIRTLATFDHPAIVKIHTAGRLDDGRLYIVMQFIDGSPLDKVLKESGVTLERAVYITTRMSEALHKAHMAGFVHRDVKPANILLDANGEPHLSDFGLAIHENEQHKYCGDGSGTMPYRAPEQVHRQADWMDARCDIWALGVVLYEMLTGRKPFTGRTVAERDDQIIHREPRSLRTINDKIPVKLQEVCLKCLRKDPAQRFTAADELANALKTMEHRLLNGGGDRYATQGQEVVTESQDKMDSANKIFISYAHSDPSEKALAQEIYASLSAANKQCFIDTRMTPGVEWVREIEQRLDWCDCFIVLISRNSMKSEMVQTEVRLAHGLRRRTQRPRILQVRLGDCGPLDYELNLYLGSLHYLQWSGQQDSLGIAQSLLEAVNGEKDDSRWETDSELREAEAQDPGSQSRPSPSSNVRSMTVPGGTIKPNDPLYIRRPADDTVVECSEGFNTVVLKGPRQHGKSSMLLNYLFACQQAAKKIAYIDLSVFSSDEMEDYIGFLVRFAQLLAHRLGYDPREADCIDSQYSMTQFVERMLDKINGPAVIALDEADRLFGHDYQNDFFSMLRMWHNNRSSFLTPQWERTDLAMAISTEPYLLISESDRSPFNVGLTLEVKPFTLEECQELNRRLGGSLTFDAECELHELLGGHPYLTRLAFYHLYGKRAISFKELVASAHQEFGPFGEHLRAMLFKLHKCPELLAAMNRVVTQGNLDNQDLYYRLYGAGLVRAQDRRINPSNLLYARYFRNIL